MDRTIEQLSSGTTAQPSTSAVSGGGQLSVRREDAPGKDTLAQWDKLVERGGSSDVTQLSSWATVRRCAGYNPVYIFAYRSGRVVGGALVLFRRAFGVITVGYLPYGPVVDRDLTDAGAANLALVDAVRELADELTMLFVQPPEGAEDTSAALRDKGFRVSRAGIAPAGSYRLDLTTPLPEIRGAFSKRLKSWTNRWAAKGVKVRQGDESDLPLLLELMEYTGARQGFTPPPLSYVRTLYQTLAGTGNAALFIGEVNGAAVSADLVTVCGGMIRGRLGGFNSTGDAGKLSVPAAVRWEIIQWGQREGHRYLDFGGLPEQMLNDMIDRGIRSSDDWPSAQRGKLAFNGSPFRYPTPVEHIRPGAFRLVYDLLRNNPRGQQVLTWAKVRFRGQFRVRDNCETR
jgi:lipid II:glycine glycyltransferase (peptidoglycan interpeptide bridge formation enzyme)